MGYKKSFAFALRFMMIFGIVGCCYSVARPQSDPLCASTPKSRLQVIIIAVSKFDNPVWGSAQPLNESIEAAAAKVSEYFEKNFPGVEIHKFQTYDETTSDSLRQMLTNCLKVWGKDNVTLMFILSHGQAILDGAGIPRDLMFMTSDTSREDPLTHVPQHPAAKAIQVGAMLQLAFRQLRRGSVLWVFLDTCNSGAANDAQLTFTAELNEFIGLKTMMLAASGPEDKTYKAALTRSLVALWEEGLPSNGRCMRPPPKPQQDLSDDDPLWSKMRKIIQDEAGQDVSADQGPRTLVEYDGPLCLDTFVAGNGGIVFFNPSPQPLNVDVLPTDPQQVNQKISFKVFPSGDKLNLIPRKLKRIPYVIVVRSPDGIESPQLVDLSTGDPFRLMTLSPDQRLNQTQVAALNEEVSKFFYVMGAPIDQVVEFEKRAELAYRTAGNLAAVEKTQAAVSALAELEPIAPEWTLSSNFWTQAPEQIISVSKERNYNLAYITLGLNLTGQYKKAADLQVRIAEDSLDIERRDALLKNAVYGYLAAGERNEAKAIQRTYSDVDTALSRECPTCKQATNTSAPTIGQAGVIRSTASTIRVP
jgi:hypothetical protein